MLKHFLWFSRKPADEREAAILSVAYQRSLAATWAGLVLFFFVVSPYSGVLRSISLGHAVVLLEVVLCASIVAGWTAVRREHLEFKSVLHAHRLAFWKLVVFWLVVTFVGMLPILVQPRLFYVSIFSVCIACVASGMIWTANWTKPYTVHSRLLATFLLPFQTIGFLLDPTASLMRRTLFAVVVTIGAVGVPVAMWVPFVGNVAAAGGFSGPVAVGYEQEEGFIPTVYDYRLVGGVHAGDLVEFDPKGENLFELKPSRNIFLIDYDSRQKRAMLKQVQGDFILGRVNSVNGDMLSLEVLDAVGESTNSFEPDIVRLIHEHHSVTVPISSVFAKVITDAPLANRLYR